MALTVAALAYALLAGLRKVNDFDLFWQLATGRWVAQHHAVFSTDVFSYTASGQPWIYPVGSGLIFYAAFLAGGYALISWLGAFACAGTVALLMRRNTPIAAALAVIAVPSIAVRTAPRADMFTIVLFAAFLSVLWMKYEHGTGNLWLLPPLMLAWVNLHLGFLSGLLLCVFYAAAQALRLAPSAGSPQSSAELKQTALWLAALFAATLVNPWGWNIYLAVLRQGEVMNIHSAEIQEWSSVTPGWGLLKQALELSNPASSSEWLLLIAATAIVIALFRRKWLAAVLLAGSIWLALRHIRFVAELGEIVVVVAGALLTAEWKTMKAPKRKMQLRGGLAVFLASAILLLALVRSAELVTNRYYLKFDQRTTFGAGLSSWFPDQAMDFIEREKLPAQILNGYEEGGFLLWKLGSVYPDFIDGRALPFGPFALDNLQRLRLAGPDSPLLLHTADTLGIRTIVFALSHDGGLEHVAAVLPQYCNSANWRPVYLDQTSAVFVRQTPQTQPLIARFAVNCATAQIPFADSLSNRAEEFERQANAASVLLALNRGQDAINASTRALSIFDRSAPLYLIRGRALLLTNHPTEAESDLLHSAMLEDKEEPWSILGETYHAQHRLPETIQALEHLASLQAQPSETWLNIGYVNIEAGSPMEALKAFDRAQAAAPAGNASWTLAQADDGRAIVLQMSGNIAQAAHYDELAVQLAPQVPAFWSHLSQLYQALGRTDDAARAADRSAALSASPAH